MLLALVVAATGCDTMKGGHRWGADAGCPVSWKRVSQAAKKAALDPVTWIPAVGAVVFTVDDFDHRTSDWAGEHPPIFGSKKTAEHTSDVLVQSLLAETLVTALAAPSGDDLGE